MQQNLYYMRVRYVIQDEQRRLLQVKSDIVRGIMQPIDAETPNLKEAYHGQKIGA